MENQTTPSSSMSIDELILIAEHMREVADIRHVLLQRTVKRNDQSFQFLSRKVEMGMDVSDISRRILSDLGRGSTQLDVTQAEEMVDMTRRIYQFIGRLKDYVFGEVKFKGRDDCPELTPRVMFERIESFIRWFLDHPGERPPFDLVTAEELNKWHYAFTS